MNDDHELLALRLISGVILEVDCVNGVGADCVSFYLDPVCREHGGKVSTAAAAAPPFVRSSRNQQTMRVFLRQHESLKVL